MDTLPSRGDTSEKDPARTEEERVSGTSGLEQKKLRMRTILGQIHDKASSVFEFSLQWEEINEELKEQAMAMDLKEKSVMEKLKEVEEREREVGLLEKSLTVRLKEIEKENDMVQSLESSVVEKDMGELEEKKKEIERLSKLTDEKSYELERRMKDFDDKQKRSIDRRRKEAEVVETRKKEIELLNEAIKEKEDIFEAKAKEMESKRKLMESKEKKLEETVKKLDLKKRELETKEKTLRSLDESIKEKEKIFEAKAKELETKSKLVELKEQKHEEKAKELALKQREFEARSMQGETSKRSRVKLLAERSSDADSSFIHPVKSLKPHEDKEIGSGSSLQIVEPQGGEIEEEVVFIDEEEEPDPITCPDSEFSNFNKTMSSFTVNQVWALYDHVDDMPRCYARIKRVFKSKLSLQVTWVVPYDDQESVVPVSCGNFKYGLTEPVTQSYLMFSHDMHRTSHGRFFFSMNPRKGETWAMFRDWKKTWNNNPELHKPPYRYDFVEILLDFNDDLGVQVAYLGKVDGFVSVFKYAEQHGVLSTIITTEEMNRFSHRVPSFRLSGEEKEGVPVGSFELDPAAIPASMLRRNLSIREKAKGKEMERQIAECSKAREVNDQDGSRKEVPIILD